MQTAVISCDFLLAPAYCDSKSLAGRVLALVDISRSISNLPFLVLEENALNKMIEENRYPCEGIFKNSLSELKDFTYSTKDVARVIGKILQEASSFSEVTKERVVDWAAKNQNPKFEIISEKRKNQLEDLVEDISLHNELEAFRTCLLHYCQVSEFKNIEFQGTLVEIIPPIKKDLPYSFSSSVEIYYDYRDYLSSLDYVELFNRAQNECQLRLSFYAGVLHRMASQNQQFDLLSFEIVNIGQGFIDSLKKNQCYPGQRFSSVLLDSVISLLAGMPKNEVKTFNTSATSITPRKYGDQFTAYRTHLTKSGVGLRLMFWSNEFGEVVLANVGPKAELVIDNP